MRRTNFMGRMNKGYNWSIESEIRFSRKNKKKKLSGEDGNYDVTEGVSGIRSELRAQPHSNH